MGHTQYVWSLAYHPTGKVLASGSADNSIILWDVTNPQNPRPLASPLTGHTGGVMSLAFSPDGNLLASGSADKTIILWDTHDLSATTQIGNHLNKHLKSIYSLVFSPDGKTLASGGADNTIRLWDITNPRAPLLLNTPLQNHPAHINTLAFSPNGQFLAAGSCGTVVKPENQAADYTCTSGEVLLWEVASPQRPQKLAVSLRAHNKAVNSVVFNPAGNILASAGEKTIVLWDFTDPQTPRQLAAPLALHTNNVQNLAFSPDGKTLASGSCATTNAKGYCTAGEIIWWDVTNPSAPQAFSTVRGGHSNWVTALKFDPLGTTLASSSWDTTILLWNLPPR